MFEERTEIPFNYVSLDPRVLIGPNCNNISSFKYFKAKQLLHLVLIEFGFLGL